MTIPDFTNAITNHSAQALVVVINKILVATYGLASKY